MRMRVRRDAVIEIEAGDGTYPLIREDDQSILDWLRVPVTLEEGVTPATLFRALRPWSKVLSRMAWMDFDAWESAAARAHLREVGVPEDASVQDPFDDNGPLASVEISPQVSLSQRVDQPILAVGWATFGVGADGEGYRSLSFASPSAWFHLPLRVNSYSVFNERFLKESRLSPRGAEGSPMSFVRPVYVPPVFWDAIVKGFLDGVSAQGTPDEAKAKRERVASAMAELREIEGMRPAYMPMEGT